MKLSFFTKSGGAGIIRGEQIAKQLGAKLNPIDGYKDDICIYIKMVPPVDYPKNTYLDIVEDSDGLRWLLENTPTDIKLLASSDTIFDYLETLQNKKVLIHEHHCNFERERRTRKGVKVAGIIGNAASFQYPLDEIAKRLKKLGIELKTLIQRRFVKREEVVDFYKQIDVQLIWRPKSDGILRNPLKISNASSFGIPTVAYPEENFIAEYKSYFLEADSIDKMVHLVKSLRDYQTLYDEYALACIRVSEAYHIDHISKQYLKLT